MNENVKKRTLQQTLKDNIGKFIGVYYMIITEQGFLSESQFGILREASEEVIVLESLGDIILPVKNIFIHRVVVRHEETKT